MSERSNGAPTTAGSSTGEAWSRASEHAVQSSEHLVNSILKANRAFVSSFGAKTRDDDGVRESTTDELAYTHEGWTFERTVDTREELGVGDSVQFTKLLSDTDIQMYSQITGDANRLHLDEEFAKETRFGRRIVHGGLVSGLISAALARLPGLTIYLSQSLDFHAPADIGTELTAVCEVVEDLGEDRYRLETLVRNEESDDTLIKGEAVVLIDELPDADE